MDKIKQISKEINKCNNSSELFKCDWL